MTDVVATIETILWLAVAYGASAKQAGLDGNIVRATKIEEIAAK